MINKFQTFAFFACVSAITFAYKYEVQFNDEEIILPCPEYPNNFLDTITTIPENITFLTDVSTYVAGDFTIIYDFDPLKNYMANLEFYKRNRGNWQKTVYTIRRDDFCKSFFNPSEMWSSFIKEVPTRLRKCPFKKGQIYHVNLTTDQSFEMPSGSLEGEYWAHFEGGDSSNLKSFCCANAYFNIYRV